MTARFLPVLVGLYAFAQQQNAPHIGYLYPAGGRQDTSFEVTAGGQFLNGVDKAWITGSGVAANVVKYIRPMSPGQANELRQEMQALIEKRNKGATLTPAEERTITENRARLMEFQRRPSSPAIAETVVLEVMVARDAPTGVRELRLATSAGLTNPIRLQVGRLPEYTRPVARVPPAFAVVNGATPPARLAGRQPDPPTAITLPAVVNGQMMPGASDRYRFTAKRGQRIVVAAAARELIPYISDAVPGWFQAAIALRDSSGRELEAADHYRFHPDPVLYYEIPVDGEYVFEIHDSIYRGREDFVYRVSIGELPFLTGIFPLGGKSGTKIKVEMHGWNLSASVAFEDERHQPQGVYPVSVSGSNELPFAVGTLPEAMANSGATRREKAQKVKLPTTINGRIAHPGDSVFFRVEARAGEEIAVEVIARRLDSPLDSILRLTNSAGKELAVNDDFEDRGAGLLTHHADSRILFRFPVKGTYYLQLTDTQRKGGPEYAYRLRIAHPEPDFELRVAPSSLNVRAGNTAPVTVYAIRHDGFAGEIALKLKDAPSGFVMSGGVIPSGLDKVRFTLTAPRTPAGTPAAIELEGRAEIGGREVDRIAVPAEDMMQAFAYHHLVAQKDWMVRVIGTGAGTAWRAPERAVKLPAGGTVALQLFVPPRLVSDVQFTLNEPPDGVSIQSVTPSGNGVSVVLRAAADKAKPGLRGNLIVDAFVERAAPNQAAGAKRRQPMGTLPAIPFEVVP